MALIPRYFRRKYLRPRSLLLTLAVVLFLDVFSILSSRPAPIRSTTLPAHLKDQKIFIASMFRNSEYMLRLYWNKRLLNLIRHLGPQNVYVSIVESGSLEDTKGALRDLQQELIDLRVEHRIQLGISSQEQSASLEMVPTEGEDRTGWIYTGRAQSWEVRRIPYLAALRNQAMEPLADTKAKMVFDRVLWINDVIFSREEVKELTAPKTEDVTTLLATRDGEYAAVCALDIASDPDTYYDTFALRDINGDKTASQHYPYFFSSVSRSALQASLPTPVASCWNGLISLDANPFYANPPLKFRGIPDSLGDEHLEGSECCLIHADNAQLRREKGVWINPNVRVAYNASAYSKANGGAEIKSDVADVNYGVPGGDGSVWPGRREMITGIWMNRWARWFKRAQIWSEKRVVMSRVRGWIEKGERLDPPQQRAELGLECLINEMQVLFGSGWRHV
ncbi:polysaccharide export protein [Diplocarpon rosae]|nr:polysaccharide export protein [Diplocarpon rosae]